MHLSYNNQGNQNIIRQFSGRVVDRECAIYFRSESGGYRIQIEGAGEYFVSTDGLEVRSLSHSETNQEFHNLALNNTIVHLATALQHQFRLHASSIRKDNAIVAFLGESGRGKSTLAAYLQAESHDRWARTSDDVLSVMWTTDAVMAVADSGINAEHTDGDQFPLAAIYVLAQPSSVFAQPSIEKLEGSQAVYALIANTIAASLFPPDLVIEHLEFCSRLAEQLPVWRVAYPHTRAALRFMEAEVASLSN